MRIRDLLIDAARRLGGGADARLDAELLLAHALGVSRASLYAHAEDEPSDAVHDAFLRLADERMRGVPVAYLVGHREFWSLDLVVTPAVLVPRPETESLVELALERLERDTDALVADLGTGSGAIALAIARERPHSRIVATDRSEAALDVARGNARRLAIANVAFAAGDWYEALAERFDVIVSNPPYVAAGDPHLEGDVRHEPVPALVAGTDGLDALRRIVAGAPRHLRAGGSLLVEHGFDQGDAVRRLFRESGFLDVETARDAGGRERVTLGRVPT
jgi:release factor glutamine methyltransferase